MSLLEEGKENDLVRNIERCVEVQFFKIVCTYVIFFCKSNTFIIIKCRIRFVASSHSTLWRFKLLVFVDIFSKTYFYI